MRLLGRWLAAALAGLAYVIVLPTFGLFLIVKHASLDLWHVLTEDGQGTNHRERIERDNS